MANLNEQIKVDRSVSQVVRDGNGKLQSWYEMQMTFTVTRSPVTGRPVFAGGAGVGGRAHLVFVYNPSTGALVETQGDYFGTFHGELVNEAVGRSGAGQVSVADISDFGSGVSARLTAVNAALAADIGDGASGLLLGSGEVYSPLKITPKALTGDEIMRLHDLLLGMGVRGCIELAPGASYTLTPTSLTAKITALGQNYTVTPTISIPAPDLPGGRQAVFQAIIGEGASGEGNCLKSVRVVDPGRGYSTPPVATITRGAGDTTGTGAAIEFELVALPWQVASVGLIGNGAKLVVPGTVTRGYAMQLYGYTSAPWERNNTLPFCNFALVGPGMSNSTSIHAAQTNAVDGILFGQTLGADTYQQSQAGAASLIYINRVRTIGFRDNRVYGDTSYIIFHNDCESTRFWRGGDIYWSGADAGENYRHSGGLVANGKTSKTGVLRIAITDRGKGYTAAPAVTVAAPASGTVATAQAIVRRGEVVAIEVTVEGSGYDKKPPPAVTIAAPPAVAGNRTAKAVAICCAQAIFMPQGAGVDASYAGLSFDYNDQVYGIFGGSLYFSDCHLEASAPLPFGYHCQAVEEAINVQIRGGYVAATYRDGESIVGRKLFEFDTINGGGQVSWSCGAAVGAGDSSVLASINGTVRPNRLSIDGLSAYISGSDAMHLGASFNRLINPGLEHATALYGWTVPSVAGVTVTKSAGNGRSGGASARIVCAQASAASVLESPKVPVAPGQRVVCEFWGRLTSYGAGGSDAEGTAGAARAFAVYLDAQGNDIESVQIVGTASWDAQMAGYVRYAQGLNCAPPGAASVVLRIKDENLIGTLDIDDAYIAAFA